MVLDAVVCRHRWEWLADATLWQYRAGGVQQRACPHPTWRRSISGAGYVCGWGGAEPEDAGDDARDPEDP